MKTYFVTVKETVQKQYLVDAKSKKEAEENYKDGELDGPYESHTENGQLLAKNCYKNGEKVDMSYCEE